MTVYDENWARAEAAKRKWMAENSLYTEETEHSSCGVGLVVSVSGQKSRKVVEAVPPTGPLLQVKGWRKAKPRWVQEGQAIVGTPPRAPRTPVDTVAMAGGETLVRRASARRLSLASWRPRRPVRHRW